MKCPACYNELKTIQIGRLTVDVCQGGCGGIWFDAFELQQVDEADDTAGACLLHIDRDERVHVDPQRKRACPRCPEVKLKRRFFSPKRLVEIDECPGCGGCWLDAGELEKIRQETEQTKTERTGPRSYLTGAVIRYLYEFRLRRETED